MRGHAADKPAALSRLLARAEDELGTRLFERDAEGVHPNPHGEVVLAAARDITRRYDQLRADLAELLDPGTGTVRLAFLDSIATSLVPRILHDFRADAPQVRVVLRQEPGHEMLRGLASGLSELALIGFRVLLYELLQAEGMTPRISFESADLITIEGLVGADLGLAILPEQLVGASGTTGVPLTAAGAERVIGLTWRTDRSLPPAAARFLTFLRHAGPFD